jgi:hypothetical protein
LFNDKLRFKSISIGLLGFLIGTAIVLHYYLVWFWVGLHDAADKQQLAQMIESDPHLWIVQNRIGDIFAVLAGFAACHFSGAKGLRNTLAVGCLLVLLGVLGIFMHPLHPTAMQIGKIIWPIPVTLFGGWLRMLLSPKQRSIQGDV